MSHNENSTSGDKAENVNSTYLFTALCFIISFSIFARAPLTAVCFVHGSISRIDNRRRWQWGASFIERWRGLSLPGTARAIALGMRVRTMSFPSIKGPCFHPPARSGDRSFGLVSNARAMTLPHFAVQTAIHSALPPDTPCVSPERCTMEVSCVICSRCNDRSRVSSARIGLNRFKDRDRA